MHSGNTCFSVTFKNAVTVKDCENDSKVCLRSWTSSEFFALFLSPSKTDLGIKENVTVSVTS